MKKITHIILPLLFITACTPFLPTNLPTGNLTAIQVAYDFDIFDKQQNTKWREEQIPHNLIPPSAIEPWVLHLKDLQNRTADDKAKDLVLARMDMIKAQSTIYDMTRYKGALEMKKTDQNGIKGSNYEVTEKIDCDNVLIIAKHYGLYHVVVESLKEFQNKMDRLLENSDLQPILGVNNERVAFYGSRLPGAPDQIRTAVKAVKDQCDIEIVIS